MNFDGSDLERLRNAIAVAYDAQDLEIMLRFRLDKHWGWITTSATSLPVAVFTVLKEAEKDGWLVELIKKAAEYRQDNAEFVAVCQGLLRRFSVHPIVTATKRPSIEMFDLKDQMGVFAQSWKNPPPKVLAFKVTYGHKLFLDHLRDRLRARMQRPRTAVGDTIDLEFLSLSEASDELQRQMQRLKSERLLLPIHVIEEDDEGAAEHIWVLADTTAITYPHSLVLLCYGKPYATFPRAAGLIPEPMFTPSHLEEWLRQYMEEYDELSWIEDHLTVCRDHFTAYCFPDGKPRIVRIYQQLALFSQCLDEHWDEDKLCQELRAFQENQNYALS